MAAIGGISARRQRDELHREMLEHIKAAGVYVTNHAEDFLAKKDSDEIVCEGGLEITIKLENYATTTISLNREIFVLTDETGASDGKND